VGFIRFPNPPFAVTKQALTLAKFLQLPEIKPASEYINGEVIQKPMPKGQHSRLQGKLCATINQVTEEQKVACAFPELRCSFGDRSIVPDVAIFQWNRIPFTQDGQVPDNFESIPP
jgi:Uma2 family endonuclease